MRNELPARRALPALFIVLLLLSATSAMGGVVVGLPADATGNCFPFGCAFNGVYQQVYNSGLFSGPISILDLEFFNTMTDTGATGMNTGTWTISLSTTSADWNTLSGTYTDNIGGDNTQVFSGDLAQPWAFGNTLHILLSTPFAYDPGAGNLLMTVESSGVTHPDGLLFFDTNGLGNPNTYLGRLYDGVSDNGPESGVNVGYGLVTGFSTTGDVPEPGSFGLLGIGLIGMAFAVRRARHSAQSR